MPRPQSLDQCYSVTVYIYFLHLHFIFKISRRKILRRLIGIPKPTPEILCKVIKEVLTIFQSKIMLSTKNYFLLGALKHPCPLKMA